jgi:hypothetical protein
VSLDQSELASAVRDLLERANPMTPGIWARATARLARQALEAALDDLWRLRAPGLELCSARAQLLCLFRFIFVAIGDGPSMCPTRGRGSAGRLSSPSTEPNCGFARADRHLSEARTVVQLS